MKSVFFVQSSSTELASLEVIRRNGIPKDDVRFALLRGYSSFSDYEAVDVPSFMRGSYFRSLRMKKFSRNAEAFFELIDELTAQDEFHAFLPQFFESFVPLLVSIPNLDGFSHIEEGLHSSVYEIDEPLGRGPLREVEQRIKSWFLRRQLAKVDRSTTFNIYPVFSSSEVTQYYRFSKSAFPKATESLVVELSIAEAVESHLTNIPHLGENCPVVLIADSFDFSDEDEFRTYVELVGRTLKKSFHEPIQNIYLKPHPKSRNTEALHRMSEALAALHNPNLCVHVLPLDFPLETLFRDEYSPVLIGGVSSLLVYGALCNKRCVSFCKGIHKEQSLSRLHHKYCKRCFDPTYAA